MNRSAGFGVEVVGCRHILILHARVQAQHVLSSGVTSDGVSDSSVFNESTLGRNVRAKADIRTVFSSVSGLWLAQTRDFLYHGPKYHVG